MSILEDVIKDMNQLETGKGEKKYSRIRSIDFVKGFAMCLIVLAHCSDAWLDYEWRYAYGLVYSILDVFGPSLFIFLSALSVVFSLRRKTGVVPERVIRNSIFVRGISIMGLGVLYNLIARPDLPFPLILWGWDILMFIGAAQIITYYVIKLSRGNRIAIGLFIVFLTEQIRVYLAANMDNPVIVIVNFIIVSPTPQIPFFPYVSLCFFSSIFGELFFEAMILETEEAYKETFRSFMKWGLLFVLIGMAIPFVDGQFFVTEAQYPIADYPFIENLPTMAAQNWVVIDLFPKFLLRGTSANLFYALGMALLILGISFYYIDIKNHDNSFVKMLLFYGQTSLTIFFLHYPFLVLYFRQFNVAIYFFIWIGFLGFIGFVMYIWNKQWNGKYTLEWIMARMGGKKEEPAKYKDKDRFF